MTRKTNQQAVIYCRVSTKKQAREGNGLTSQETRCREYAKHRGHNVVGVFTDDVSGKLAQRPGFDEMLSSIRKKGMVVIIDDISRMARDVRNHFDLKESIFRAGATLESPSIEFGSDSDSILIEHLLASVAQHQRQKNGEQAKNRMRARMLGGYWVFMAPLGYRYEKSGSGGSILVRDEPVASIIQEGLEGYARGRFNSKAEVKRFLESHAGFPVCRHGHLTNQQAHRIMTHPIYAGHIQSDAWGVSLRPGQHEAVISLVTFHQIQERLAGKPLAPTRADIHVDFPLRGFVTCGDCDHPMTSNWTKGRSGRYPYYVCRRRGCDRFGKSVKRETVEGAFEAMLTKLTPRPELLSLFSKLFRKRWDEAAAKANEGRTAMKREMAGIEKKIGNILDRIMEAESRAVIARYESEVEKLELEKLVLDEKVASCGTLARDYDATFRTAFEFIANPWNLWTNGTFDDKRIVLNLTLGSHLEYDWNEGVRTAELSLPFMVLDRLGNREVVMAGYYVFEPNPRGSYGQGEAFTAANKRDFGGGDLRDILSGVDAVIRAAPVDGNRLGLMGGSYGGFMAMWTNTQTNRFKAIVSGAGLSNWISYYGTNGIDQWMLPFFGKTMYDDPKAYEDVSAIYRMKKAKTPTFIYVGERDIEVPPTQSIEYWHALKDQGVPTSLVIYPDEGHAIRDPEHSADLRRRTIGWFDRYVKAAK